MCVCVCPRQCGTLGILAVCVCGLAVCMHVYECVSVCVFLAACVCVILDSATFSAIVWLYLPSGCVRVFRLAVCVFAVQLCACMCMCVVSV
jgi:hypothetical protein